MGAGLTTFDGFGLGLLRDAWRIPSYVDDYNDAPRHIDLLHAQAIHTRRPPWSIARLLGQYMAGRWYGTIAQCLPPEALGEAISGLLPATAPPLLAHAFDVHMLADLLGMSLGVFLVATLGRTRASLRLILLGAAVGQCARLLEEPGADEAYVYSLSGYNLLGAMAACYYSSHWDPAVLTCAALLFLPCTLSREERAEGGGGWLWSGGNPHREAGAAPARGSALSSSPSASSGNHHSFY